MKEYFSCDLILYMAKDICRNGKCLFFLIFLLFITMMGIVYLTHTTREFIKQKGILGLQSQTLIHEAINLTLEETTLMDKSRVRNLAQLHLQMKPVERSQEILVSE